MVKAVTSFGRSGVSDWLVQRVTAVILLSYFAFLAWVLLTGVTYVEWKNLFATTWMRVFSLMAVLSLGSHAWIGMWSVLTDYITERMLGSKGNALRIGAQLLCSLALFVYVIWGVQILWGN